MAAFGLKVKISAYAMPMLVFGLVLRFQEKRELKGLGSILAGLGFLFLGIHYMKEGFESFQGSIDLVEYAVGGLKGLFLFTIIGVAATVIMQSSHATLMLIIVALAAGQITYENALALAIGANIGTTITAILGAISSHIQLGDRAPRNRLHFSVQMGGGVSLGLCRYRIRQLDAQAIGVSYALQPGRRHRDDASNSSDGAVPGEKDSGCKGDRAAQADLPQ
jgi:phosphate:Na+ symporter